MSIADHFREAYRPRTATEMQLVQDEWRAKHKEITDMWRDEVGKINENAWRTLLGRTVSAKRARFLRRRGDDVRYSGRTSTGKARYTWTRRAFKVVAGAISSVVDTPNVKWFGLDMASGPDVTGWR